MQSEIFQAFICYDFYDYGCREFYVWVCFCQKEIAKNLSGLQFFLFVAISV